MLSVFVVSLFFCSTSAYNQHQTVICEHATKSIQCPAGQIIDVKNAFYGRDDKKTCGGPVRTTSCKAANSLGKILASCQDQPSCSLRASNSVYGDPCVGTFKYIRLQYTCVPSYGINQTVICEHATKSIQCPAGQIIDVKKAFYGRDDKNTCGGPVRTTSCKAANSLGKILASCQDQPSCSLRASNSVYGDPCVGTFKFIRLQYTCVPSYGIRHKVICEHRVDSVRCPVNHVIRVEHAFYGRDDGTTCGGPVQTTTCAANGALDKIKDSCGGRQTCSLLASNSVFGDPCYGSFKYIRLSYTCEEMEYATKVICEHRSSSISCPAYMKIIVVDAFYGRDEGLGVCGGPVKTNTCRSYTSLGKIKAKCHGKKYCSLWASNSVFGDPCVGTFKYIKVMYRCKV